MCGATLHSHSQLHRRWQRWMFAPWLEATAQSVQTQFTAFPSPSNVSLQPRQPLRALAPCPTLPGLARTNLKHEPGTMSPDTAAAKKPYRKKQTCIFRFASKSKTLSKLIFFLLPVSDVNSLCPYERSCSWQKTSCMGVGGQLQLQNVEETHNRWTICYPQQHKTLHLNQRLWWALRFSAHF